MRMRSIIFLSLACPVTLSHKRHDFRKKKKVTEHKMCVLISSETSIWNISHSKKSWAGYDQKCTLLFMSSARYRCQILIKLEFSRQILKKTLKYQNVMSVRPVGTKLFHADGRTARQTHMTQLIFAFSQCWQYAKEYCYWSPSLWKPRRNKKEWRFSSTYP